MIRSRRTSQLGQSTVELALVLPVLLLVIVGILQFGMAFLRFQEVSAATNEGARRASNLYATDASTRTTDITTTVRGAVGVTSTGTLNPSNISVSVTSTWTPGDTVTVTSRYAESIDIMGIVLWSGNLTSAKTSRVVN